jgi:hypothetical protein
VGYQIEDRKFWSLAFRAGAIFLFAILSTAQCAVLALGETFGDPVGEIVKRAQF